MSNGLLIGVVGGALGGSVVTAVVNWTTTAANWRREDRREVRLARRTTYLDAVRYAQRVETMAAHSQWELSSANRKWFDAGHPDPITAALRLTAPRSTLAAWQALVEAEDLFRNQTAEDFSGDPFDVPDDDYPPLVALNRCLEAFFREIERDFSTS